MFERFTDRARRVVVLAQEEARMLNHNYIGTEHLLLGLIHEGDGVAARALDDLGVNLDAVRVEVESAIGMGQQSASGHIPFTPRAKKVLELSLKEALQLGHNHIGTEHILLGLLRESDGVACQVLVGFGLDPNRVRQAVIQRTAREPGEPRVAFGFGTFTTIEQRLTRIERRLGIVSPPRSPQLTSLDERIAEIRRDKEAAIDAQDFERAGPLRDQEKRLVREREAAEKAEPDVPVTPVFDELADARAEIARLTALLREHDIDPGPASGAGGSGGPASGAGGSGEEPPAAAEG
jgi:ATP-dependent Clp protease ATP-binding subunit ClpA